MLVLLSWFACGDTQANAVPEPAATQPNPPGRSVSQCCSRPEAQAVFDDVLAVQALVANGDDAALQAALGALVEPSQHLADTTSSPHFDAVVEALAPCEGQACVDSFGAVADGWAAYLERSRVGDRQLAIAYDLEVHHAFFVTGHELEGPYGSSRSQLSWGSKESAVAFSEAMEAHMARVRNLPNP